MSAAVVDTPGISQRHRLLRLRTTLDEDILLPTSFRATEGLSELFRVSLEMSTELTQSRIVTKQDLLGTPMCLSASVTSDYEGGPWRHFNGIVSRFYEKDSDSRFQYFAAELVPWLWLLKLDSTCRIFQAKTIPEIAESIFEEYKAHYPKLVAYQDLTSRQYTRLDYCVQYRESSFNFISRLFEEEGIYYYFQHSANGHTLVFTDTRAAHGMCPEQPCARRALQAGWGDFDSPVLSWTEGRELRPGQYSLRDYHFQMPSKSLQVEEPTVLNNRVAEHIEVYDYPGEYASRFTQTPRSGEVQPEAEKIVRLRMEELEATHQEIAATSLCRAFTPGQKFELIDSSGRAGRFLLTRVEHSGKQTPWYLAEDGAPSDDEPYVNTFTCLPEKVQFRPARGTARPVVMGPQTAVVVGKQGEEIWTDEFGRVKVQFHWDREGKNDENSSCWVRVSQPWAGNQWGSVAIPRIGQEVVIDFLEGDPDQPIITGRVYNASQMPPYKLPAEAHVMGFRSKSVKGSGANEIAIHDAKDQEKVIIYAQKDMSTTVQQNQNTVIAHGNQTNDVKEGSQSDTVKKAISIKSTEDQIYIEAKTQIWLKVGDSELFMDKSGNILLKGVHLDVEGSSLTEIKGKPVKINCD